MNKFDPGKLRSRIQIQTLTLTDDNQGGHTETWSKFADAYAQIKSMSAKEQMFADKLDQKISHIVLTRYIPDVTHKMRVLFDSRYLYIKAVVIKNEVKSFLELQCEEGPVT